MFKLFLLLITLYSFGASAQVNPNVMPESTYPYWPTYQHLEVPDLDTIQAQKWINKEHVINGWDWSLPVFVEPSPRSSVGLQRIIGLDKDYLPIHLKFKANPVGLLWVRWRDIEPIPGNYNFEPIIKRIKQAQSVGSKISLRILSNSKARGANSNAVSNGEAPLWLEDLGVTLLSRKDPKDNLNFNPAHPEFHKRYLMLINALSKTEIPKLVKAAYVGYASHSFGDEGIGPYGEGNSAANDTAKHVRERLDAWQNAFKGMENKVFMGGSCDYGFNKGFGVRRGFVEMYLYNIPNRDLGQFIDQNGYLSIDEESPIIKNQCFNGEVNEEYEKSWATPERGFRFGNTTNSFPYRYFTSTLRALQMRCTYIHTTGHLLPKMLPFLSLQLARNVNDAPDVWCFLRTSYMNAGNYKNNDWKNRPITDKEKSDGIEAKNFERWLYQRDAPGYETQPAVKIQQSIKMWMVQEGKYYDYIARSGKKIGFDIDDRWTATKDSLALKVTYFDNHAGEFNLVYNNGKKMVQKSQKLNGDGNLKTVTFFLANLKANSLEYKYDFTLVAGKNTKNIMVSMVRVVQSSKSAIVNIHPKSIESMAQTPPMGWNSFDSYGVYLHEKAAKDNLEAFAKKLKPYGYEYFVIDAGWFGEFKLQPGTMFPAEKHAAKMKFNEFGLLQPSDTYFPNGFKKLIGRCHELGLKFGLHLMRGIPRAAVKANVPIKGTKYFAQDIADTTSICNWNQQNYGVDMTKPGAQEFYNSLINQMAEWGVDFIKYDDIVPFPEEVKAVANAIAQCGRPMILSLSPGGNVDPNHLEAFQKGHMLRVTPDIWDDQKGINECFQEWRKWHGKSQPGFWIDMDMIPFGQLQMMSPKPAGVTGKETKKELMDKIKSGEIATFELLAGKGFNRWSEFTKDQMYTFITLRALSASPLMMGGDLPTLDDFSMKLLTDKEMLKCNQNGVMGILVYEAAGIEIWKTPKKNSKEGWIGIFNRTEEIKSISLKPENLGLDAIASYKLQDVWNTSEVSTFDFKINPNGVVFLKYSK